MKKSMLTCETLDRFEREYKTEHYTPEQVETIEHAAYVANMNRCSHPEWTEADIFADFIRVLGIHKIETEPAEADETETNEQEGTEMKYDYVESMKRDILDYIADEIDRADYDDRDELETALNDDLWAEDAITGNGCWGYGKYHEIPDETIRNYVRENLDLCKEALREFCTEKDEIIDKFFDDDYSYFDCTIRCYCLNWAISKALDELENDGYFDDDENEEN